MLDHKPRYPLSRRIQIISTSMIVVAGIGTANAANAKPTRFWNLTGATIVKFELRSGSSGKFGPDQCKNDADHSVDDDERLPIEGVASGVHDARITFKNGRVCFVKAISVKEGKIFTIETKQLTDCTSKK